MRRASSLYFGCTSGTKAPLFTKKQIYFIWWLLCHLFKQNQINIAGKHNDDTAAAFALMILRGIGYIAMVGRFLDIEVTSVD
ncbi:hypothetical protein Hdeb2414_s0010g00346321 [Helianthus debilis subsp. tardiflorus]